MSLRQLWNRTSTTTKVATGVVLLGILLRFVFWLIYPENWRLHAIFTPIDSSAIEYLVNFEGYKPGRMPFFDFFSAGLYILFEPILGYRALSLFSVATSSVALPLFYCAVKKIYDNQVALAGLVLFALHPQALVLGGSGYPEAAASAFVVISLYSIVTCVYSDRAGALIGGVFALIAYLMYVPAVAFGVITTIWIYACEVRRGNGLLVLPGKKVLYFALPSAVVGLLYLGYGPVSTITSRQIQTQSTNVQNYMFSVESYSLAEQVVRYIVYAYIDFWWHTPGFDHERHIMQLVSGLSAFLGSWFPVYAIGWVGITGGLTVMILVGIHRMLQRRSLNYGYVLTWIGVYVFLWNLKNIGWVGGFNTRHVYPLFPAVCIVFGVGATTLSRRGLTDGITDRIPSVDTRRLLAALAILGLALLVINAGFQGTIRAEKRSIVAQQPISALDATVEENDTVAVPNRRDYDYTLIYTGGRIRPQILAQSDKIAPIKFRTTLATVRYVDPGQVSQSGIDYLYIRNYQCKSLTPYQRALVENATASGGQLIYNQTVRRPQFRCDRFTAYIIRINSTDGSMR